MNQTPAQWQIACWTGSIEHVSCTHMCAAQPVWLSVERSTMSEPRPSQKNWYAVLFFDIAAAAGTIIDIVLNFWGPARVHGSATPPRRKPRRNLRMDTPERTSSTENTGSR